MPGNRDWNVPCKVYIGNLNHNASRSELEAVFVKYGPIKKIWVARNPPGFAFIEFEDPRDAEDAVREMDRSRLFGGKVRVEMSTGRSRNDRNRRSRSVTPRSRRRKRTRSRSRSRTRRSRSRSR